MIKVFKQKSGKWNAVVVAPNGTILHATKSYKEKKTLKKYLLSLYNSIAEGWDKTFPAFPGHLE